MRRTLRSASLAPFSTSLRGRRGTCSHALSKWSPVKYLFSIWSFLFLLWQNYCKLRGRKFRRSGMGKQTFFGQIFESSILNKFNSGHTNSVISLPFSFYWKILRLSTWHNMIGTARLYNAVEFEYGHVTSVANSYGLLVKNVSNLKKRRKICNYRHKRLPLFQNIIRYRNSSYSVKKGSDGP